MKLTYAIGDVHGMLGPLAELVATCLEHASDEFNQDSPKFVFVGDYIDRGPDSRGVVDFLLALAQAHECVFLRGNHEDMLMNDWPNFCYNGGWETLESYGWDRDSGDNPGYHLFPEAHMKFFRDTKMYHVDSLRTYVHAGISRARTMPAQSDSYLMWVRNPFLFDDSMDGGYVVHGHTPQENGLDPMERDNRINIDTGAVFGGALTAAVFNETEVKPIEILQVYSFKKGPL